MGIQAMNDGRDGTAVKPEPRMAVVDADRTAGQYRISETGYRRA
jgi:hypothetical protein